MTVREYDKSGYPKVSSEDMQWIVELLESKAEHPDDIEGVARERDGLDLEIFFVVSPRSKHIFTEDVCLDIARQVSEKTGVFSPVMYVYGDPHPTAREALNYAAQRV